MESLATSQTKRRPGRLGRGFFGPRYISNQVVDASLRLQTLVLLRWLAVIGQTAAVLIVYFGFKFELPLGSCVTMIAASAALNMFVSMRYPATKRLTENESAFYLAFDIVQLAVLLWLTGGLRNPFVILFLAPVMISASVLSMAKTTGLVALAFICVTFLGISSFSLPWYPGETFAQPILYQVGVWGAVVLGLAFSAIYAHRVAGEARKMSEALTATQTVLSHEQQLSALGGLAAAAAHELGTPLATIALVSKEMAREIEEDDPLSSDVALLTEQADRCREILSRLSTNLQSGDAVIDQPEIGALLDQVIGPYEEAGISVDLVLLPLGDAQGSEGIEEPRVKRRPEILYGLGNFVQNAVDFSRELVTVSVDWEPDGPAIRISVEDDGPGFRPEVFEQLGEPYVTTRPRAGPKAAGNYEGLGLGVFIAKTLIERTGGQVTFSNQVTPKTGAIIDILWPNGMNETSKP